MSNQRIYRKELRQGLHQFLMMTYQTYLESQSVEDAKLLVQKELEHQYRLFFHEEITEKVLIQLLSERKENLEEKANQAEKDDEKDLFLDCMDQISSIESMIDSIKKGN